MLTQCPQCRTVFRVSAAQLKNRGGRVRCGGCRSAFSALEGLLDEKALEMLADGETPTVDLAILDATAPPAKDAIESATLESKLDDAAALVGLRALPGDLGLLFEEEPVEIRRRRRTSGWLWGLLSAITLLALLLQVSWFQQLRMFDRFPQVKPWFTKVCAVVGCELMQRRQVQAFKLAARDIREHPRYQDTLLVNATLVNNADFNQPFPRLQLSLFDETATMIGARRFMPNEYLDDSITITAGIAPAAHVFIVLEIAGPTREAVSFEFSFL